jgi:hypothetical protein
VSQNRIPIGQRMYEALGPLGAVVVEEMDATPRGTVEVGLLSLLHSAVYNAIGVAQLIDHYREEHAPAKPVVSTTSGCDHGPDASCRTCDFWRGFISGGPSTTPHSHKYTLDAKHGRVGSCVCGDTHTFGATR